VTGDIELGAADAVIRGVDPGGELGQDVAAAGDMDGDGLDDVLIGSVSSYAALVFHGPVVGELDPTAADRELHCQPWASACGWQVAGGRDLDGDGYDDALVGTCWALGGDSYLWRGAVYVHRGGP